jgi:hypothetical protein
MKRALTAASLTAMVFAAAGCGATTPATVALRQARDSGGTQARALRVERWRIANGDAVDVVLVRARFCGTKNGFTAPRIHGRCVPQEVYFATRPGAKGGFAAFLAHGDAQRAAAAWKARPVFRIFPDFPDLLVRCKIPRGGGGTVKGLCEAKLDGDRAVAFLEHWPLSKPSGRRNTAGWIVTLDRSDRVVSVRETGSTPPQSRP